MTNAEGELLWDRVQRHQHEGREGAQFRCIVCEESICGCSVDSPAAMVYKRSPGRITRFSVEGKNAIVHENCWDEGEAWATREGLLWRNAKYESEEAAEADPPPSWRDFPSNP